MNISISKVENGYQIKISMGLLDSKIHVAKNVAEVIGVVSGEIKKKLG